MRRQVLGALALAVALTACGTDGDGGSQVASAGGTGKATASAAPSLNNQDKMMKFAQCMRENGIEMDDPVPGKGIRIMSKPGQEETMKKAQEACKQYAPSGEGGPGGAANAEKMRALAKCMRDNGVAEFPDPEPNGGMRINRNVGEDPDFPEAQKKCQFDFGGGS
ncbi:hypothetical protein HII36_07275 [Nonomuraea sp. NN258]|uniref:hypothetical protein n=1 Tax=Nonomuraea antri TaxID=2730852 RepID=UPI001569183F|nr:hypothetical protein [Nonomuraea antri]NRQ31642.1 hypothetical protein [Nonomuraea antri]